MAKKPTYEELEKKCKKLMKEALARKRAEEALYESEEKYRILIENIPSVTWITSEHGKTTFISPNVEWAYGFKAEEIYEKGEDLWFKRIHPDDRKQVQESFIKMFNEGGKFDLEYRIKNKDGEWIWLHDTALRTHEIDNVRYAYGVFSDVTERKKAEETIKESEEKYRNLIESLQQGIWLIDKNAHTTFVNPPMADMLGYTVDEMQGKHLLDFMDEKNIVIADKKLENRRRGIKEQHEFEFRRKDGSRVFTLLETKPINDKHGNYAGAIAGVIDITERKRSEESLKLFRTLIERSNDAIEVIDPETGRFLDVNEKCCADLGYSSEELLSLKVFDIDPQIDPSLYPEVTMNELRKAGSSIRESLHKRKDGTKFPVEINLSYVQLDRDYIVTVARDITERKRMEEELLKAQKLESVGILAGGIAHDFNNILTAIIGNISLAKNQVTPEDEIFDLLNEAEMASTRAQGLTKQLLTFAKGGTPVKEAASVKDIIKESTLFALRGSKSICEFSIGEDLLPVEVDVGQFNQVINNIMINATQAMPLGGTIKVAVENLIIEERDYLPIKPGRYIGISITDQGIGIAEEYLSKIFDPYFTTKQKGSGLGLATTYSIIKRHDGHITVESRQGVGTTFHIYLPASEKAIPEKEEFRLIKGQGRILVMDDEASLRRTIERMLKGLGYEPEFAKDGAEAINMVKKAREAGTSYDAVILDLTVPGGMGGKECITKLLEIDPGIKAIVSSGYSEDPVLSNFQEYGFKGMMPKPFKARTLSKVLHDALKGEKE
jgi:PAS domain S-box-containing protein